MKTLYYTFRTNKFKDKIPEAFIFGKLKEDFEVFSKRILEENPDLILGIAKSSKSQLEQFAINQFNKNKIIDKNGPKSINLYIPNKTSINKSKKTSDSFCNWTTYKIAKLLLDNNLNTKIAFAHIKEEDLDNLKRL